MATSNRDNAGTVDGTNGVDVATLWALAGAGANYDVHENAPLSGISGDTGDGFIVKLLPVPDGFAAISTENGRVLAFRAYASAALRIGQSAVKASKAPTSQLAQDAVSAVLAGTHKPAREVDNGILSSQATAELKSRVRVNIVSQIAAKVAAGEILQPSEKEVDNTVNANAEAFAKSERGKTVDAEIRSEILANGRYKVSRKAEKTATITAVTYTG